MLTLWMCVLFVVLSHTRAADLTLTPEAKGNAVVEQVIQLIQGECIFKDDRLFLRRLAHIESHDGTDADTYTTGYHGGIWKVDQEKFMGTQTSSALTYLATEITAIKAAAKLNNIDWAAVTWEDLRKPLYSGLGVWLYLVYTSNRDAIPTEISAQASYWTMYYRPKASLDDFRNAIDTLEKGCSGVGVDLVFVLDGSGSISGPQFNQMREFVVGIVGHFDVSPSKTQVGVIQFSSAVTDHFALNNYSTQAEVIDAVTNMPKRSGGTLTGLALEYLREMALTSDAGARQSIAKVGVVVTDGKSTKESETIRQAGLNKDAKITMIAIGVGSGIDHAELEAIASEPTCQHLYLLNGFSDFAGLAANIEMRSCGAPLELSPADNDTININTSLPPGGSQNCKVQVPLQGTTVKLSPEKGNVKYYVAQDTYPNEAFYDVMTEAGPGETGVLYLSRKTIEDNDSFFCNIEGDPDVESTFNLGVKPGDHDWCRLEPCQNGGACKDTGNSFECACTNMYMGSFCETRISTTTEAGVSGLFYNPRIFMLIQMTLIFSMSL